jgi:D-serine dehydratase
MAAKESDDHFLQSSLLATPQARTPFLWLNPELGKPLPPGAPSPTWVGEAERRIRR